MGEFEPVELRRVMAGRDHNAAVDAIVNPGEIEHRRNNGADIDDVAAAGPQAPHDRVADPGRTLPIVAANNDREAHPPPPPPSPPPGGGGRRGAAKGSISGGKGAGRVRGAS